MQVFPSRATVLSDGARLLVVLTRPFDLFDKVGQVRVDGHIVGEGLQFVFPKFLWWSGFRVWG